MLVSAALTQMGYLAFVASKLPFIEHRHGRRSVFPCKGLLNERPPLRQGLAGWRPSGVLQLDEAARLEPLDAFRRGSKS